MTAIPGPLQQEARRSFRLRSRLSRAVWLIWLLTGVLASRDFRHTVFEPATSDLLRNIALFGIPIVLLFSVWEARCTACSGWLRFNGHTCRSCGRDLRDEASQTR